MKKNRFKFLPIVNLHCGEPLFARVGADLTSLSTLQLS
jgi:hypothetical protein